MKRGLDVATAPPPRPRSARGESRISQWGYRFVLIDDTHEWAKLREAMQGTRRTIFEHRIVLAAKLGRPLLPTETAHHINGDKLDNRAENLELWTRGQPPGQRVDDLIAFMVNNYPEQVKAALEARHGQ